MSRDRATVATIGLLLLTYLWSYLVLSDPCQCGVSRGGGYTGQMVPNHRVGGEAAERVFRPLEMLDRKARPGFWAPQHINFNQVPVRSPVWHGDD